MNPCFVKIAIGYRRQGKGGDGELSQNSLKRSRRALLAKVHIAKKEALHNDDALYRRILREEFGVESSADLDNRELEQLVKRFEKKGWQAKSGARSQVEALKERIGQELLHSEFTTRQLRGLVRKICKVDDLRFCHDAGRLKRLLAAIGRIKENEEEKRRSPEP
jgi:phage gp16-like protein